MIPKIIHYCWLSNDPIPAELQKCMNSWKRYLPDYEFMLWNFDRFPKGKSKWVDDAFNNKKYAFAADYIRLYALYNYGGIYLDTDVEVCRSFDPMLGLHTMICWESDMQGPEVAAFGVEKGSEWVKLFLDSYNDKNFIQTDGKFNTIPLPKRVYSILQSSKFALCNVDSIKNAAVIETSTRLPIFPPEYFSPKSFDTGIINRTSNTYSIHHFSGSWLPWYYRAECKFWNSFGMANQDILKRLINNLHGNGKTIKKIRSFFEF